MARQRNQHEESGIQREKGFDMENWDPKTEVGKRIKSGEIVDICEVLNSGMRILEDKIVDALVPNLQKDLMEIGQSKGKFGGGKRSIWKQTQTKSKDGNRASFSTVAVVGNEDGYIGLGRGKARETVPAREKATKQAKLNLIKIKRGCGSWECGCGSAHSIPYKVTGKHGSIEVTLMPAPKGTRLCAEKECQKILKFAGIKDVYMKTRGHTKTKINLIYACMDALKQLSKVKVAEAKIYFKDGTVIKERVKKEYRHEEIDNVIRRSNTRREVKLLKKALDIIPVPKVIESCDRQMIIKMEFIEGKKLRDLVEEVSEDERKDIFFRVGKKIAKLHNEDIIHGDLTTSNLIMNDKIYFIDFGLGFVSTKVEDKAVDLHLIERALHSKHYKFAEEAFESVLEGYASESKEFDKIMTRFAKVALRGRYKRSKKA